LGDLLRSTLRVAAGHHDLRFGIFAMDATDGGSCILIGSGGDSTGVENHDFGLGRAWRTIKPPLLELTLQSGAISLRRSAPEILNVILRHLMIIASAILCRVLRTAFQRCTIHSTCRI